MWRQDSIANRRLPGFWIFLLDISDPPGYRSGVKNTECTATELTFKGRNFRREELALICDMVSSYPALSRQELANTVCELLDWHRPGGGLKTWECKELLEALEERGLLELPALRAVGRPRGRRTRVDRTAAGEAGELIEGHVRDVAPVTLRLVEQACERALWRELVDRHHYLGHKVPFGAHLRYLVEIAGPRPGVAGCVQLSSPAWRMECRDSWIGWDEPTRQQNLQRVVNNSRLLLLPWVRVRNLASTTLALVARSFPDTWEQRFGVRPVLLETLVDSTRFRGVCYRAANWLPLGTTSGRGRMDRAHERHGDSPKTVLVYPLRRDARDQLRARA